MKLFALLGAALLAASPAYAIRCAPGYHNSRHGNCQPNVRQTNRYCPRGYAFEPFPGGWRCTAGNSVLYRGATP